MITSLTRALVYCAFLFLPLTFVRIVSNLSISDVLFVIAFLLISISPSGKKFLKETATVKNIFLIPLFIFSLGFLISINMSIEPLESLTAYLQIVFIFAIAYPVIVEVINKDRQLTILAIMLIIPGIIISILMMLLKFIGIDLGFDMLAYEGWRGRFSYGGMEPNVPGRIILQNIPFLAVFVLSVRRMWTKIFLLSLIVVQLLAIFLTSSRSNMLSFVLGVVLFSLFAVRVGRRIKVKQLFPIAFVIVILLSIFMISDSEFMDKPLERYSTILNPQKSASSLERIRVLNMGLNYLDHNPLIGLGLGNSYLYTKVSVHNPIILTWVENGVLGVIGFTGFYLILLYSGYRTYKDRFYMNEMLMGLTIVMFLMVFGDMFMANSYKRVLWLPALLFFAYANRIKCATKDSVTD